MYGLYKLYKSFVNWYCGRKEQSKLRKKCSD
jgi:hypothetical protein